jgi:hypothetical protein
MTLDDPHQRRGFKFSAFAILALLAVIVIGDRIRINRPHHKYLLTVELETPQGIRSASNVVSVTPNRSYGGSGSGESSDPRIKGDAVFVGLGAGRNLVALLAVGEPANPVEMSYLALRAYRAAGRPVDFRDMKNATGTVPVTGELTPVLISFGNPEDPATARLVKSGDAEQILGKGIRLRAITVATVPNGIWPLDFGGWLGEPVTRGIETKLPWLSRSDQSAETALKAAGIRIDGGAPARWLFER